MYNNIHISTEWHTILNTNALNIKKNQFDNGRVDVLNELWNVKSPLYNLTVQSNIEWINYLYFNMCAIKVLTWFKKTILDMLIMLHTIILIWNAIYIL